MGADLRPSLHGLTSLSQKKPINNILFQNSWKLTSDPPSMDPPPPQHKIKTKYFEMGNFENLKLWQSKTNRNLFKKKTYKKFFFK